MQTPSAYREALASENPVMSLREAVGAALRWSQPREEILSELETLRTEVRKAGHPEHEDAILEVMDFLTGWSSPHVRLSEQRRYGMYFEIVSASGGVRLNLKSDNNEIMLQSEVYTSKAAAKNAIKEIQSAAATAPVKDEA
jgi:uncharacterized protein YegP (UPF0339 family)